MSDKTPKVLKLTRVRISYPHLYKRAVFEGQEGKFEATFLVKKDDPQVPAIKNHINEIRKGLKFKVASDKLAIRDGDESGREESEGHWVIKASSNRRPMVIDRRKQPIFDDDGTIYGGCIVNATVDFWVQNNKYGKRINCNLRAVQFHEDGDPFGVGPVNDDSMFDELDDGPTAVSDDSEDFSDDDEGF